MKILRDLPIQVATNLRHTYGATIREDAEIEIEAIGSPAVVKPGYAATKNTLMRIRIGDIKTWIEYDRVDGQTFLGRFTNPAYMSTGMVITKPIVATTHDIVEDFSTFMANPFSVDEIIDEPLVINADNTITLRFSPSCIWFTGQYRVKLQSPTVLVDGRPVVSVAPVVGDFDNCNTVQGIAAYSPGFLTYDIDYSEFTSDLQLMNVTANWEWNTTPIGSAVADMNKLVSILNAKDGLPWNNGTAVKPFNLYSGGIIYNGPSDEYFNPLILNFGGAAFQGGPGFLAENCQRAKKEYEYVLAYVVNGKYGFGNSNYDVMFIHYGKKRDPATIDGPERPPVHHWPMRFKDRRNYGTSDVPSGMRGGWWAYQDRDYPLFVVHGVRPVTNSIGLAMLSGCSLTGVDLPVDRDFTFSFRMRIHGNPQNNSNVVALWGKALLGSKRGTLGAWGNTNWGMGGTGWELARENISFSVRPYPHWNTVTLVRRGRAWLIYYDGQFSQIAFGDHENDVIDMLYTYYADQLITIEDIYYFDWAMSGKQVRKLMAKEYDIDKKFPTVPVPEPLHHWPLNGVLENLGKSKTPINGVFDWKLYDGEKWGARVNGQGGQSIGVALDISKDFTFQFDYIPASDANVSGILCGENVTTQSDGALKSSNGIVFINGTTNVYDSTVEKMRAGIPVRWTIVKKGTYFFSYINGQMDRATNRGQTGLTTVVNAWTHFGRSFDYMNNADMTRNWKYWDEALSPDQVYSEAYRK